jgi:succinyl-diaminopimelate desuccinylase
MEKMKEEDFDIPLLKKLIGIPTISSDHQANFKALQFIKGKLDFFRIPVKLKSHNGFPFLIAGNLENAKITFLSHIDVVGAQPSQFKLVKKGEKIIGRGSLDMKGPLVVALSSFIRLWQSGFRQFIFVVTSDEEIGGFNGTAILAKTLLRNIKAAIILDASSSEDLVLIQKAPFHIKISHQGKSAHGSRPWDASNSVQKVAECALEVSRVLHKEKESETSAVVTQIHGGTATNVIPDNASSTLDIRIKGSREISGIIKNIEAIVKKYGCKWEKIDEPLFVNISQSDSLIKKWIRAFEGISGKIPDFMVEPGASDARFLGRKISIIITSPWGGGVHSNDEWVNLDSLFLLQKVLIEFCNSIK